MEKTHKNVDASTRDTLKQVLRLGYRFARAIIPMNRCGDKFFSFVNFVIRHRRVPSNKHIFNDVLYKIKTTDEILDPLRVFV